MKTLQEYICSIREDWEEDLDQSKLYFFPKNEKIFKKLFTKWKNGAIMIS